MRRQIEKNIVYVELKFPSIYAHWSMLQLSLLRVALRTHKVALDLGVKRAAFQVARSCNSTRRSASQPTDVVPC
jgi:hypothetical protein